MTISTKKLTNEELRQIIDSHEKGHGMCVPVNYGYIAAKELLAVREAQSVPVYLPEPNNRPPSLAGKAERDYLRGRNETLKECIYTLKKCGICITHVKPGTRMSALVMPEHAAPPAPAVDWEHISNEWADVATSALVWLKNIADGISTPETAIENTKLGIAAVRAAMLQPVSRGYTLPAGWIACSDRMPTEGGRYLAWVEEQNSLGLSCYVDNVAWHDDAVGFRATGAVNFWMPLPAAPTPTKAVNDA